MKSALKKIVLMMLTYESILVLKKYRPKIIAITGSVGKTSTKFAVYSALSEFEHARKSPKSFNSEFGVPLTILGQSGPSNVMNIMGWLEVILEGLIVVIYPHHYPKWLVLEVGTDRPGDIAEITKWLKPDIVIVTKLSEVPVHVEAFGAPERLYAEKGNLVRAVKPGGTVILNGEDERVMAFKDLTSEKVITFGSGEKYEIVYESGKPAGVRFVVEGQSIELIGTLGRQHIQHIAAAMAVIKVLGEDLGIAARSFSRETPPPGRMRIIEGINNSTIIDDTYNSSPVAVEEALETLKTVDGKRKIAVLGDMLELGQFSIDAHKDIGEKAKKIADMLVTVGMRSKVMEGDKQFADSREAGEFLKNEIKEGDIVLVKGSQGTRCERIVEEVMANPKQKAKLLVRQEKEWKSR